MTRSTRDHHDRNRLYRNKQRGLLAGVCAGIADWTGFNLTALRVGVVLLAIPFTAVIVVGYILLALLLYLVATYVYPAAIVSLARKGDFGAAFDFGTVLRAAFTADYFVAGVLATAAVAAVALVRGRTGE